MSSRPPPDATAASMLSRRMPAIADGISRKMSNARGDSRAPDTSAGMTVVPRVTTRSAATTMRATCRRRTAWRRKCSRMPTSCTARRAAATFPARRFGVPVPVSVEEGAVGTGPLLAGHLLGVHGGDARAAPQHEGGAAGLDGEVPQVGGQQDRGAPRARVSDHLEGRLDADRVDAVEGLVEKQDL